VIKASQIIYHLNERFITNPNEVGSVVDALKQYAETPITQRWLSNIFRRYLINDYKRVTRILNLSEFPSSSPEWARSAFQKGKEVYKVNLDTEAREQVEHEAILILQFFQSGLAPKRFDSMKFPEALKRAKQWQKKVRRAELDKKDPEATKVVVRYGSMTWVELIKPEAYDREGDRLYNCLDRRYYDRGSKVYSLRDITNKPHCAIEVDDGEFNQIKGYTNGPIEEKYREMCLSFINDHIKPDVMSKLGMSDLEKNLKAIWVLSEKKVVGIKE
jgi:hypothetical protein